MNPVCAPSFPKKLSVELLLLCCLTIDCILITIQRLYPSCRMASIKAMAKMPSMMPPTDVIPDFVNPYSLEKWVILCAALSLSMTTVFVAIRMYVKHMVTRSLDWADCEFLQRLVDVHCA